MRVREKVKCDFPEEFHSIFDEAITTYFEAASKSGTSEQKIDETLCTFCDLVQKELHAPRQFPLYHVKITSPFDYSTFFLDFMRPVIDFDRSTLSGRSHLEAIRQHLCNQENVVLFANHQIEPDPQVIRLMLERWDKSLADEMIFVAGQRVTSDPLAIPFSLGCNLLCIYSKKYMEHPPEKKSEKQIHNKKTLRKLEELLREGGKWIYVAPSGGRDRPDAANRLTPAKPDPKSIEMFRLIAKNSSTRFYPLALSTYALLPPPSSINTDLGEKRRFTYSPVELHFGPELNLDTFPGSDASDRITLRENRANHIWNALKALLS